MITETSSPTSLSPRFGIIFAMLLAAVIAVGGFFGYQVVKAAQHKKAVAEVSLSQKQAADAIADKLGVRITQVDVTADGGLVDLRYQVIDPDKAVFMFDTLEIVPKIITTDGTVISLMSTPHRHGVEAGISYFILYRNLSGALKPGSEVTIAVDNVKLAHFAVEK